MRKMTLVLTTFLLLTGTLLAQQSLESITDRKLKTDAVLTESTESRYSAGRFGSYIDDFVSVNDYDGQVKTFLFLGGFGSESTVEQTDVPDVTLSGGFATTLKSLYLGVYYGGDLFDANGDDNGATEATVDSKYTWNNYIALLVGKLPFGALRLDLIAPDLQDTYKSEDGDKTQQESKGATAAVSWGIGMGKLSPHATLGFKWPDRSFSKTTVGEAESTTDRYEGAVLAIKAGSGYTLDDTQSLSADLVIQASFGEKETKTSPDSESTKAGAFWTFVDLGYSKELPLGDKLALGVKPNVAIALELYDPDTKNGDETDAAANTTFETRLGIDLGLRFKATQRLTAYTGLSLDIFDWIAWGASKGDGKAGGGKWQITPISFSDSNFTSNSNLGFGLVFAPDERLSVSCGINALLDRLFVVDLEKMQVKAGDLWGNLNDDGFLGGTTVWDNVKLDLTVSYKL